MEQIKWSEIDWRLEAAGSWPLPIKASACLLVFILTFLISYRLIVDPTIKEIRKERLKQDDLKEDFKKKWNKVANINFYELQMKEVEEIYKQTIYQLPTKEEISNLLSDISNIAISSGLNILLFKPQKELEKEFYSEIPILLKAKGTYHEIGVFSTKLAELPRLITIHDIKIQKQGNGDELSFQALLKTYRYLSQEERAHRKRKRRKRR